MTVASILDEFLEKLQKGGGESNATRTSLLDV